MKNLKNYKNSKFLEIQGMKILYLILEKEHRKKNNYQTIIYKRIKTISGIPSFQNLKKKKKSKRFMKDR